MAATSYLFGRNRALKPFFAAPPPCNKTLSSSLLGELSAPLPRDGPVSFTSRIQLWMNFN